MMKPILGPRIFYREGYKYQLAEAYSIMTDIVPLNGQPIQTEYLTLSERGNLTIDAGYAWDGPSGPTYDSANSLRASLVHDAFYQLMRLELIGQAWRGTADRLLDEILEEDGMWKARRWYWLRGVQWFAADAANPDSKKPILEAP